MKNHKFRVIVVDDEKLIAKNIATNISRANGSFEVVATAYNGQEAYELAQNLLPDVLFSDIKMPIMDGLKLISLINENFPSIKTVIVSGYDDFEFAREALVNNASDYLLKPINSADLENTLKKLEWKLLAEKNKFAEKRHTRPIDLVESIKAYLKGNFNKPISFSDIASQYNFSPAYLTKIFKEYTGTSPIKYLQKYRIDVARKLLWSSNLSVKEIAEKVGFEDQFHFSKNFKNVVGVSPQQFRSKILHCDSYDTRLNVNVKEYLDKD